MYIWFFLGLLFVFLCKSASSALCLRCFFAFICICCFDYMVATHLSFSVAFLISFKLISFYLLCISILFSLFFFSVFFLLCDSAFFFFFIVSSLPPPYTFSLLADPPISRSLTLLFSTLLSYVVFWRLPVEFLP